MKRTILLFYLFIIFLTSCTVLTRSVRYAGPDIDDYRVFPKYEMKENSEKFFFDHKNKSALDTLKIKNKDGLQQEINTALSGTSTRAFIVIQNDSILFEKYFNGYKKSDYSTIFSASKSVSSLLIGIAIDDGSITSVDDAVTKYIDELNSADPMFQKLSIRHLLDMQSGIDFNESYSINPFSKMARLYYGKNQLGKIKRLHFKSEPGSEHEYQSISTAILGLVIEKATRQSLAAYFEEKVWKPLGMENSASWSLDDKKHLSAKAYCGLNISAIDLAKIGRLYLKDGEFNDQQIVSKNWVDETLTPKLSNDGYQNQWYSYSGYGTDSLGNRYFNDSLAAQKLWKEKYSKQFPNYRIAKIEKKNFKKKYRNTLWDDDSTYKYGLIVYTGQYYALGIMQQILFIDPEKNIIIVRLGDNGDYNYLNLMRNISKNL